MLFRSAVVIGSRIIQEMEDATPDSAIDRVRVLMKDIRETMDKRADQ